MGAEGLLPSQRHLFELPEGVCYLNCAYMAPQLRSVTAAGQEAIARKARPWTIGPADFFEPLEDLRAAFAGIVDADADGVAITPSVSYALSLAAANLPVGAGQRIVTLAEQFPSNVYPWRARAREVGAEVHVVDRPAAGAWTDGVLEAVDERCAILALPACHWTDGSRVDLAAVGRRAREVGAALVIDASQSLGAVGLSVPEVRPDVIVAVGYKWLLGPFSLAYAWFAPSWREGQPLEQAWNTRADSQDFARLVDYRDAYREGARRYDMGEAANFALVPMALVALRQVHAWGPARIAATLQERTGAIADVAADLGLHVPDEAARAPHLIGLGLPADAPTDLASRLGAEGVHVSVRGSSLRVSPHLYNDEGDVERLRAALVAVGATGARSG